MNIRIVQSINVSCNPIISAISAHSRTWQETLLVTNGGRRTKLRSSGTRPLSKVDIERKRRVLDGMTSETGSNKKTVTRSDEDTCTDAQNVTKQ